MQKHKKMLILSVIVVLVLAGVTTVLKSMENRYGNMNGFMQTTEVMPAMMGVAEPMMMGANGGAEPMMVEDPMAATSMPMPYYGGVALDVEYRMYDRSASYDVIVDDVQQYLRSVREYVLSVDGVVLNDSYNKGNDWTTGSLYAKVPVEKFTEASDRVVDGVKEIYSSSSNSQDVTDSHVSATDRLQETQDMLAQTQAQLESTRVLLDKAEEGSTEWRQYRSEVLQLENRVASYERTIKKYESNVESIESQVSYATIMVTAVDSVRYYDPRAAVSLWDHLELALSSLGDSSYRIASFLIWVVVYSVIWAPVLGVYMWLKGKGKKK
ncbi:DUF4349 domain-containing protein [Candidatus Woesebacteria bacterium]|nr:DUF4349 domain-containing protein [Candidatus Woesebacteria bacterium]